ncbi:hypothetical protein [Neobacillus dielmonensis]|uniref:hypothetical protein n=1 Tax=Neobacillus dielmonensis TaxID=1347369 RepID=UPI0005A94CAA|nr:hypothetical protein [Neobacillus dielmonensis]
MNGLFDKNGRRTSIPPSRVLQSLTVKVERFGGESQQVRIDFLKKRFVFVVWRSPGDSKPSSENLPLGLPGSVETFKRELYNFDIWSWDSVYYKEDGIILDGKYWSVELETKVKVYQSNGIECFPSNWVLLCKSIEKLIGAPFGLEQV